MKRARKFSAISLWHYPRNDYSAYWEIGIDPATFKWAARILSYEPVGWEWGGKVTAERPAGFPVPVYPPSPRDTVAGGLVLKRVTAEENEAWLKRCAEIHEAHPRPVYLLEEHGGEAKSEDEAREASQKLVLSIMPRYRRAEPLVVLTDDHVRRFVAEFDRARAEKRFADCDRFRGLLASQGVQLEEGESIAYDGETKWSRSGGASVGATVAVLLAGVSAILWVLGADLVSGVALATMGLSTTVRNAMVAAIRDAIDGGSGAGLLRIYDGSRPATGGTATTLGAELTCSDPCAGSPSSAVLTFSSITADSSANATITATWGRFVDSSATFVGDFSVGTSGADLNLNSTSISSGQQVSVSSATITAGNA